VASKITEVAIAMANNKNVNGGEAYYEEALAKSKKEEISEFFVLELLQKSMALGNPKATYAVATWYLHGKFVKKDIRFGTKLLKKAAKLGSAEACFDLAVSYETGVGVKKDVERAFDLFLESALRGDVDANYSLYRCFWHGIGTRRNRTIAGLWRDSHRALLAR
jgi:uncharacterized protein